MKIDGINIIKICAVIIAICVLGSFVMSAYYNVKYTITGHDERKSVCDSEGLVYLKTAQRSNEIISCCEIQEKTLVDCWEFLK